MRGIVRLPNGGRFIRPLWMTALFNSAIALFLNQLQTGRDFGVTFIFSQAIGLSICVCVMAGRAFFKPVRLSALVAVVVVGVGIGGFVGVLLGVLLAGPAPNSLQGWSSLRLYPIFLVAILFGGVISYFFFSQQKISEGRLRASEERYRRLEIEKQSVETYLKLLQAQVEPHFLFNSLSTVLSLMDDDLVEGRRMLENRIRFLRASLTRARADIGTLGEELEMVAAYLRVYQVRMGSRLEFQIAVADDLQSFPLPPMLLQPLVENAISHGLEPLPEGGEVRIEAHRPAIAFLDIRMPGLSGIDVARAIGGSCWIVFVTAYDQYAVEAFEREAVDYLLKPVEQERLESTVRRLQARIASPPPDAQAELLGELLTEALARKQPAFLKWLRVQYRDEVRLIPVEDVIYFKASNKYTLVIVDDGEALIRKSIRRLSDELDPEKFWRIHRGSIVNASRIDAVKSSLTGGGSLQLKGCDQSLAVSRSYMHLFKQM